MNERRVEPIVPITRINDLEIETKPSPVCLRVTNRYKTDMCNVGQLNKLMVNTRVPRPEITWLNQFFGHKIMTSNLVA